MQLSRPPSGKKEYEPDNNNEAAAVGLTAKDVAEDAECRGEHELQE